MIINKFKKSINYLLSISGYQLRKIDESHSFFIPSGASVDEIETLKLVRNCTMAPPLRTFSLIKIVKYIIDNNIAGDFVECGVWRGGSAMAIAKTLYDLGISDRKIYLYDTFKGMTEAGILDVNLLNNQSYNEIKSKTEFNPNLHVWAYASISEVKKNMLKTKFSPKQTVYIEGDVKFTLLDNLPNRIALLRLDTDFYESTAIELEKLYPLVTTGGSIIIDDYGSWAGSQIATDEYRKRHNIESYLNIIDEDARVFFKK